MGWSLLATGVAAIWVIMLLLPWQPWRNREVLEAANIPNSTNSNLRPPLPQGEGWGEGALKSAIPNQKQEPNLTDITVVIPARNEAAVIATTLQALAAQDYPLKVILVDDASNDGTATIAQQIQGLELRIITSQTLPEGWSGKLWALEQACAQVETPITLLLDADIQLAPGLVAALRDKMQRENRQFVSLMASLRMQSFWEKLLMPAFVYFFKLLYPFALSNSKWQGIAAAAGGCIMLETRLIQEIGGFAAIRGALIDDCTLARTIKSRGHRTWIGLSRSVVSLRAYERLNDIWDMVARTAYTQLHYSFALLLLCTTLMTALFWLPPLGLLLGGGTVWVSALAYGLMVLLYLPTLMFYGRNPLWAFTMPLIAALYLAMTWSSAIRYWRGVRSRWKGRDYA